MRIVCGAPPEDGRSTPGEGALTVILKSEKYVTLTVKEKPLPAILKEVSAQTGQSLQVDPQLRADLITASILFRRVPLQRALGVLAYLAQGVWKPEGDGLTLRPIDPSATNLGGDRQRELLADVVSALKDIDPDDPVLSPQVRDGLRELRTAANPKTMVFTGDPATALREGTVEVIDGTLKFVYVDADGRRVAVWN